MPYLKHEMRDDNNPRFEDGLLEKISSENSTPEEKAGLWE